MTSLVNKSVDWTPNYHKILIFFPTKSLKSLYAARIDELVDSNEPANISLSGYQSDMMCFLNRSVRVGVSRSKSSSLDQCQLTALLGDLFVYICYFLEGRSDQRLYVDRDWPN